MKHPKIGIRPVIDGRWGGVRESLEKQTMDMANAAAKLISKNLFYSDGTPVECIIADGTIGCGAEAAICDEKFSKSNVIATLTVTKCWCYGSETMDLNNNNIKAIWGFNGTERPGAVYLAAALSAHAQKRMPAFSIYGNDVQDINDDNIPKDVAEKILRFAKCAIAVGAMKNTSYVNIGSVSMGIAGSICNDTFLQKYLGIRAEWIDMTEILRRISLNIFDHEEFSKAKNWVKENCKEGIDVNKGKKLSDIVLKSKHIKEDWDFIIKMTLIIRDILIGNPKLASNGWKEEALGKNAIAGGFQGQRMWTDWLPNCDFSEAIINSTFDWNGNREPIPFATENDVLNGITMLFIKLLTNKAAVFADIRTYWSQNSVERICNKKLDEKSAKGFIHLINSGSAALDGTGLAKDSDNNFCMKEWWNINQSDIHEMLSATKWCKANYEYFRGGGFSSQFKTSSEMPITLVRLNIVDGIGPTLQFIEGNTVLLDKTIDTTIDNRTDKTWPTTWFVPRLTKNNGCKDVYSVMANWGANHGAFAYGHIGKDLITLASMLRIPVSLHNLCDCDIYRPHSWAAFGTENLEAADYQACKTYGPFYK